MPDTDKADVCLLLEGTYPYVRGGVSTWVHQVISAMPDVSFAIVFIGAEKDQAGERKYEIPSNVVSLTEVFLFDPIPSLDGPVRKLEKQAFRELMDQVSDLLIGSSNSMDTIAGDPVMESMAEALMKLSDVAASGVDFEWAWRHPLTWETLTEVYDERMPDTPFVDYFWNMRFLVQPLWKLLQIFPRIPEARLYHSVSTGYAGMLGALAERRNGSAFLLSEHGIYVRERIAELLRAEWSPTAGNSIPVPSGGIGPLRKLWIDFFIEMGRFSYLSAAGIVSLFERNADMQIEFGARADRIRVIPNGVDLARFEAARQERLQKRQSEHQRKTVGFLGRIVAIKDIKMLLHAARMTLDGVPDARFLLIGPDDEEPGYAVECRRLAEDLGLDEKNLLFTGSAPVEQALSEIDVMALSSISEGLPFAVLEAFAVEMPVVATDVGACRELIEGRWNEKPMLGAAGKVTSAGDAGAFAAALTELLKDRSLQDRCGAAGRARVERSYTEAKVIQEYRSLYEELATAELVTR